MNEKFPLGDYYRGGFATIHGSNGTKPEVKQIEISIWHKDQSPVDDPPREQGGVMQDTLEATIAFAAEMIRSHWNGECDCQQRKEE